MIRRRPSLRPAGFDEIGLRQAFSGWILPFLVGAMAFLAMLALAGAAGIAELGRQWHLGPAAPLTLQVPDPHAPAPARAGLPAASRVARALALLRGMDGIASAHLLSEADMVALLRPWLGEEAERIALPLPALIEVRPRPGGPDARAIAAHLAGPVPGAVVQDEGPWLRGLARFARSLRAVALAVLAVVAAVACGVIVVATRMGLAARREAVEIVHALGASDGYVAARFAGRVLRLTALGGLAGAAAGLPVVGVLAALADALRQPGTPAVGGAIDSAALLAGMDPLAAVPALFWFAPFGLGALAAAIGWLTAQVTVRRWLRQFP
jgi:cell division transport system permease protein